MRRRDGLRLRLGHAGATNDGQKQIPRRLKSGLARNDNAKMLKEQGLGTGTRHGACGAEERSFVRCGGLGMTAKGEEHTFDCAQCGQTRLSVPRGAKSAQAGPSGGAGARRGFGLVQSERAEAVAADSLRQRRRRPRVRGFSADARARSRNRGRARGCRSKA